jgi:hypothetical protein
MAHSIGNSGRRAVPWTRLGLATGAGILAAVAATELLYLLASAAGVVDHSIALASLLGTGPLDPVSVATTALVATVGAGLVLGGLMLGTRHPVRTFRILATVLAALSLSMPASIPGPPPGMRLAMALMHVVVWAAVVGVLASLAGRGSAR